MFRGYAVAYTGCEAREMRLSQFLSAFVILTLVGLHMGLEYFIVHLRYIYNRLGDITEHIIIGLWWSLSPETVGLCACYV